MFLRFALEHRLDVLRSVLSLPLLPLELQRLARLQPVRLLVQDLQQQQARQIGQNLFVPVHIRVLRRESIADSADYGHQRRGFAQSSVRHCRRRAVRFQRIGRSGDAGACRRLFVPFLRLVDDRVVDPVEPDPHPGVWLAVEVHLELLHPALLVRAFALTEDLYVLLLAAVRRAVEDRDVDRPAPLVRRTPGHSPLRP